MGNHNFKPSYTLTKGQPVQIVNFKFSEEQVPKEIKTLGRGGYVIQSTKLYQSRPNCQPVYVTRVQFPKTKLYETFLTNDLKPISR